MHLRSWQLETLALFVTLGFTFLPMPSIARSAPKDDLKALEGEWLYVEDLTEGRPVEKQGPPMSTRFEFRVEEDAVIMSRGNRPEQRLALDGSMTEVAKTTSISRYRSQWADGALVFETEILRKTDESRIAMIRMEFSPTTDGLLVRVPVNGVKQISFYQHPEDIELPKPTSAVIGDMAWLSGAWIGPKGKLSTEERWTPALGGSLLGVSRTIKGEKMVGFEYLRIVERDGGLVYIAQPGGKSPTEFTLVNLEENKAVFENPRHDFPQRIVYELSSDDRMSASIGFINGGEPKRFEFQREVLNSSND